MADMSDRESVVQDGDQQEGPDRDGVEVPQAEETAEENHQPQLPHVPLRALGQHPCTGQYFCEIQ